MASRRKQKKRDRYRQDEERRFTVRGVRRDPPDIRKFSKALISLTMAAAERQAQAEHAGRDTESDQTAENDVTPGGAADG